MVVVGVDDVESVGVVVLMVYVYNMPYLYPLYKMVNVDDKGIRCCTVYGRLVVDPILVGWYVVWEDASVVEGLY